MTYDSPQALREALEQRLSNRSTATGVRVDRLRRRVVFERIVARLVSAEPGRWVLKGGMALDVRLADDARLTKDIDFGLRDAIEDGASLHVRLLRALTDDLGHGDFDFAVADPTLMAADGSGHVTWRVKVAAHLAGRLFGAISLDISPRAHELTATDHLPLPNSLDFAGVPSVMVEIVDIHRHAAEKFHGMLRSHGDRENSRVRDLVDLVLLVEHDLLRPPALAAAVATVWSERNSSTPPSELAGFPKAWPASYDRLAAELNLTATTFAAAEVLVRRLWSEMFPSEEI